MEFDAFISHASADKTAADAVCAVLEGSGIRCWVAPRDIRPGLQYGAAIVDAIDKCRVMILIFSSSANESNQVHREIERAVSKSVPIVPVRIEQVLPSKSLEYFLGAIHWLDAMTPPIENHLQRLAATVGAILHADGTAQPDRAVQSAFAQRSAMATAPLSKQGPLSRQWLWAAVAGVCVVLVAGAAWLRATRVPSSPPKPQQATPQPAPTPKQASLLVPETVPFISNRDQAVIRNEYMPAQAHKALAISFTRVGFISGQPDDDVAKAAAIDQCRKATDAAGRPEHRCDLYAVGDVVVYQGGNPPLPPSPWIVRNPSVERPFAAAEIPLIDENVRADLGREYAAPGNYSKALALSPRGTTFYYRKQPSADEAVRRALEACGKSAGVPCMIIALDERFIIPIPVTMKVTGFFHADTSAAIDAAAREDVARKLGNATSGWNAVATGTEGHPGIAVNTADEAAATAAALAQCSNHDRNCHVIAIGPFSVAAPN